MQCGCLRGPRGVVLKYSKLFEQWTIQDYFNSGHIFNKKWIGTVLGCSFKLQADVSPLLSFLEKGSACVDQVTCTVHLKYKNSECKWKKYCVFS